MIKDLHISNKEVEPKNSPQLDYHDNDDNGDETFDGYVDYIPDNHLITVKRNTKTPERSGLLKLLRILGAGSQGMVALYQDSHTGENVAVKTFFEEQNAAQERDLVVALRSYQCPRINNIMQVLDNGLQLVYPFCENGSLNDYMSTFQSPPLRFLWHVFVQLTEAVAFLQYGSGADRTGATIPISGWIPIVHGDIRDENILVAAKSSRICLYPDIRLGDFGIGKSLDSWPAESRSEYMRGDVLQIVMTVSDMNGIPSTNHIKANPLHVHLENPRIDFSALDCRSYADVTAGKRCQYTDCERSSSMESKALVRWLWRAWHDESCTALTLLQDMVPQGKQIMDQLDGTEVTMSCIGEGHRLHGWQCEEGLNAATRRDRWSDEYPTLPGKVEEEWEDIGPQRPPK